MPTLPKNSKCAELGCKQLRSRFNAYCLDHGGRDTFDHRKHNKAQARKDFNDRYQTRQWKAFRQIQLSQHPLCAGCLSEGRIVPALHVDHVFPWSQIGEHAFIHNLFQSLCHSCHTIKTHLEQKGTYRRYGTPTRNYTIHDYALVCSRSTHANPPKEGET